MEPLVAASIVVALVVVATVAGAVLRRAGGRVRGAAEALGPAELVTEAPAGRTTLVQFSTPQCARCPGTARLLGAVAGRRMGVEHVEIDLTGRPELADRFGVLQTPTVLLVDPDRTVRARIGGVPDRDALERELDLVQEGTP